MEEATRRLRALADEKDRIEGDLPHGLLASGEHAMRRPIHTPEDERYLLCEGRCKSEQEHGRDLLRALRRRTTLPDAERAAPLRVQGAGPITADALKAVQAAIDALPLSHRELIAAHGTHVYRQGKGFFRVVSPVVARHKHLGVRGSYMHELREAYVFNHQTRAAARVVTHEVGHAVHHALGHLRAGLGQTAQATNTHMPSQQPDFMRIYQQHRTNPKLGPYMRSEPGEMFAEGYMMHHRQNEHLRDAAPELHAYFCNLHEEIERCVRDAQREGRAYCTASSFAGAAERLCGRLRERFRWEELAMSMPCSLTDTELRQLIAARDRLREALQSCWTLTSYAGWSVTRSRSQDGQSLRIAITWDDGPSEAEVIALAETLGLHADQPIKLSLRRRPMVDEHRPVLHVLQSSTTSKE